MVWAPVDETRAGKLEHPPPFPLASYSSPTPLGIFPRSHRPPLPIDLSWLVL